MAFSQIHQVALRGVVSVVPSKRVDNLDVAQTARSARERLVRNIGIRYRRVCPPGMIFSDLALHAAQRLLEGLGWDRVDALILVTQSPEYPIPSTAILLQDRLGLERSTLAFDVNLGCSGYPYGLFLAASMLRQGGLQRAIAIIGDQSASQGAADEGREILFGDAASATALEWDANAPPMSFEGFSEGAGFRAIHIPHGGRRRPMSADSFIPSVCEDGVTRLGADVWLDGPAILNFSTREAPAAVQSLLNRTERSIEQVDYFFFHQANRMINETIRKKLRLPEEKSPTTLEQYGNTSSASIPITMSAAAHQRLQEGACTSLMCGVWGWAVVGLFAGA